MKITLRFISLFYLVFISFSTVVGQFQSELSESLVKEIDENLEKSSEFEAEADYNQAAYYQNKAATIYWVNGFPFKAVEHFKKTIELNQQIGNLNAIRNLYNNIGMIYTDEEDYPKAIEFFNKTIEVSRQMKRKPYIASALINLANVQAESGAHADAAQTLEEANALARELNDEKLLRNSYSLLADVYEKLGDPNKSTEYFSLYTAIQQKIQRDRMRQSDAKAREIVDKAKTELSAIDSARVVTEKELLNKQRALHETEQSLHQIEEISRERQMEIDLLSKERALQDATIKNQKMVRNIFVVIILAVLGIAVMIFLNLKEKKKANEKLSKQNKEIAEQKDVIEQVNKDLEGAFNKIDKQNKNITSSINYAQRIQHAMLPAEENLSASIPKSFVLLKPRDIVSGDFYWFSGYASPKVLKGKQRKNYVKLHNVCDDDSGFVISAIDCTGHGVPGAFMSMIGFNLLDTIIRNGVVLPNEMLNDLHRYIRFLLKQKTTDNRDGMDMSICSIKDNGRKVLFAGAKNPLIYIVNGELHQIKGDPHPVGGLQKEDKREFKMHTVDVTDPTTFYIFSDGFPDQFGGKHGKKFGTKYFKELLLEIHELPMAKQKEILEQKHMEWRGSTYNQLDDIIIIGFKLGEDDIDI